MQVVAVDVGNSSIKLMAARLDSAIVPAEIHPLWSEVRSVSLTDLEIASWFSQPMHWFVSSVNDDKRDQLKRLAEQAALVESWHVVNREEIPVTIDLEEPQKVGIDRLLAAFAAHRFFSEEHDAVVVDCGTALTIDLIDRSATFRGGVIMAGPATNLLALNSMTAALPDLSKEPLVQPECVLGRSTRQAMLSGAWHSGLGAIKEVVSAMKQVSAKSGLGQEAKVVGTGGGLGPWREVLPQDWVLVDDLVLEGILQVAISLSHSNDLPDPS